MSQNQNEILEERNGEDNYYQLNDEELEKIMFTKENVEHFSLYQKCVELVGIIGEVEMKNSVVKFTLINRSGLTIQVTIWDETAKNRITNFLISGNIIHLDGLFVNSKHPTLSKSNIQYDLSFCSNSTVHIIKAAATYTFESEEKEIPEVTIANSVKYSNRITVVAWIKQKISQESLPHCKINQGCLSDCQKFKLEVRMPIVCDMSDFPIGSHVKVTGTVKYVSEAVHLWVLTKDDIVIASPEIRKLGDLLKGVAVPKRILNDISNQPTKKMCSK